MFSKLFSKLFRKGVNVRYWDKQIAALTNELALIEPHEDVAEDVAEDVIIIHNALLTLYIVIRMDRLMTERMALQQFVAIDNLWMDVQRKLDWHPGSPYKYQTND